MMAGDYEHLLSVFDREFGGLCNPRTVMFGTEIIDNQEYIYLAWVCTSKGRVEKIRRNEARKTT